jgi:hypothetical protein
MSGPYADPYLNELQKRLDALSAITPTDEQHRRDLETLRGKILMQILALRGSRP